MKAIILDDEQGNIDNLKSMLSTYCKDVEVVGEALTVALAKKLIEQYSPEVVFLDIQLNQESGFDLLHAVDHRTFATIFVTAYNEYGIQAVKLAAIDYLLKPIDIDELIIAVAKVKQKFEYQDGKGQLELLLKHLKSNETPATIALPQQKEIRYIKLDEIIRCEADDVYTRFFLISGERICVSKPIKEYTGLLEKRSFLRTHQSHLVNLAKVSSFQKEDGGILLLQNGDRVPISKPNREKVRAALMSRSI